MTPTKVALLGGSFNPPHVAHQMMALWAITTARADQVWYVPTYKHAFGKDLIDFAHRHRMCELAVTDLPIEAVRVSDVEAQIGGAGRTLITLQTLVRSHRDCAFSLLIGADILAQKDSWYRHEEIEALAEILVVGRPGYTSPPDTIELAAVSSTIVRQRLARGEDVSHLLPAAVAAYIRQHGLYR